MNPSVARAPEALPPASGPAWPITGEAKALVVDPDPEIGAAAALHMLRGNGVTIDQARSAEAALEALSGGGYRLVILELAAREFDGADLCRRIVERRGPPVLVWSAQAAPLDQVAGLELGADDYVAKAAHPLELLARTRAVLRRAPSAGPSGDAAARLTPNAWLFDARAHSVRSWQGARVWLRPASSVLLRILCERPRQQVARDMLLRALARGEGEIAPRTVDVMVSRLRRSLEACDGGGSLVRTIRPTGYLLDAEVAAGADGAMVIRA